MKELTTDETYTYGTLTIGCSVQNGVKYLAIHAPGEYIIFQPSTFNVVLIPADQNDENNEKATVNA